jgi:hypothetical protein
VVLPDDVQNELARMLLQLASVEQPLTNSRLKKLPTSTLQWRTPNAARLRRTTTSVPMGKAWAVKARHAARRPAEAGFGR